MRPPRTGEPCVLEEGRLCDDCGDCLCDLDPDKVCDNCMRCVLGEADYRAILVSGIELPPTDGGQSGGGDA